MLVQDIGHITSSELLEIEIDPISESSKHRRVELEASSESQDESNLSADEQLQITVKCVNLNAYTINDFYSKIPALVCKLPL